MRNDSRDMAYWIRTIAFWFFTGLVTLEITASSMWALLKIEYVRVDLGHLGYPLFILNILAAWELPCAVVILLPKFPNLKEWAYAGMFFNYSGAAASHIFIGDNLKSAIFPAILALFTLASRFLRPMNRISSGVKDDSEVKPYQWVVPIIAYLFMLTMALLTIPKGPPPSFN